MTPAERIEVAEALAELGDTAEAVAATLLERGHLGRRGSGYFCPVAVYLRDEFGGRLRVHVAYGPPLPDPVTAFVDDFDAGKWPELVRPVAAASPVGVGEDLTGGATGAGTGRPSGTTVAAETDDGPAGSTNATRPGGCSPGSS